MLAKRGRRGAASGRGSSDRPYDIRSADAAIGSSAYGRGKTAPVPAPSVVVKRKRVLAKDPE